MNLLHGMALALKRFLYHLLHLGYGLITFCARLLSHFGSFHHSSSRRVQKLPRHLGLLVDSEDAIAHVSELVQLLEHLAHMGLQHVSVYDVKGSLKSVLADALKSNPMLQPYSSNTGGAQLRSEAVNYANIEDFSKHFAEHEFSCERKGQLMVVNYANIENFSKHSAEHEISCERKGQLMVEVLCHRDGKHVIVEAARNLCVIALLGLQSDAACRKLKEEDIEESLRQIGGMGPDPDLLLLFSDSRCLQGFPPWRLRLTEIQHVGPIKYVSKKAIFQAFDEFSHKQQRYGK